MHRSLDMDAQMKYICILGFFFVLVSIAGIERANGASECGRSSPDIEAFNIVARIDDLLYVDDLTKQSDKFLSNPTVSVIAHKKVPIPYSCMSRALHSTTLTMPSLSPAPLVSPARGERIPFLRSNKPPPRRGFGVREVLTNYLGVEAKSKSCGSITEVSPLALSNNDEAPTAQNGNDNQENRKVVSSLHTSRA